MIHGNMILPANVIIYGWSEFEIICFLFQPKLKSDVKHL